MATYFTNSNNQRDATPMFYLREPLPSLYPEASTLPNNMMMYMNSASYSSDALAGNSHQQNGCIEMPNVEASDSTSQRPDIIGNYRGSRIGQHDFNEWREGRNQMVVTNPLSGTPTILHGQNLQGQGLSLSLSTLIPSGMQVPSISYRNSNLGFSSLVNPNPLNSGNQDSNGAEFSMYGMSSIARTIPNSKYLKAAQQLLDDVVNVRKALKEHDSEKNQSTHEHQIKSSRDNDYGSKTKSALKPGIGGSSNPQDSANSSQWELSHAEKQDLQNKLTKLLSMLDEVDRRYRQYYHQMQIVVSSFDAIAGCGAAKPYTSLALQTISRHFRCLRDAITGQIQATRKSLGEQDGSGNINGVGIPRLRYVDQQLRQQRALQQLGMMQQHAWRPQRGLPESSVSILRAWLFEHFLHPYPKDSDKIMLARQTGLTRSQVSNWFINARVRLWKPMVEEMYKEEAGDTEMNTNCSSENVATGVKKSDVRTSEDGVEDLQQSASSTGVERCITGQFVDLKSDEVPDIQYAGSTGSASFQNGIFHETAEPEYGLVKHREDERPSLDDCSLFPDTFVQSDSSNERFMAAYQMTELNRLGAGSGVSLTLGLQHCDGSSSLPMSSGNNHNFGAMRGDGIYNAAASSIGPEPSEFECMDSGNEQHRFNSSHLLHDFVV